MSWLRLAMVGEPPTRTRWRAWPKGPGPWVLVARMTLADALRQEHRVVLVVNGFTA